MVNDVLSASTKAALRMDVPLASDGFSMLVSTLEVTSQSNFRFFWSTRAVQQVSTPEVVYDIATSRAKVSRKPDITGAVPAGSTGRKKEKPSSKPKSKEQNSVIDTDETSSIDSRL